MKGRFSSALIGGQFAGDLVLTLLALKIAEFLRLHLITGLERREQFVAVEPDVFVLVLIIWAFFFFLFGAFDPQRRISLIGDLGNLWLSITISMLVLASLFYLLALVPPAAPSRLFYAYFYVLDMVLLTAAHLAVASSLSALRSRGRHVSRVLLVGGGIRGRHVAIRLRGRHAAGFQLIGYLAAEGDEPIRDLKLLGRFQDLVEIVRREQIDDVVVALPAEAHAEVMALAERLQDTDATIRILPDVLELVAMKAAVEDFYGLPLISVSEPSITPVQARIKRVFDLTIAGVGLAVLSPLIGAIALLVRLDSTGPVLIHQRRVGAGGKPFYMHKFRSMSWDPELLDVGYAKKVADPRVTRLGRFLRRTSLDELPQLWNVVRGEMSIVGPRPELPAIVADYEPWQLKRFAVPPGMTGWWQVNGRSERSMHLNTEIDLYYVQNYSIMLDVEILLRTVGAVIRGKGAF